MKALQHCDSLRVPALIKLKLKPLVRLDWAAIGWWALVTSLSSLVGLIAGYIAAMLFAVRLAGDWTPYALFGLVFGLTTGLSQSLVLGRWVAQPLGWILATAFGEACSFTGFALLSYVNASRSASLLIIGLAASLLGLAQWSLLRRWAKNAIWWIPATVSGKMLGVIVVASLASRSDFGFDAVLALQAPYALITATTLSVLFRDTERLFPSSVSPKPLDL